jgi:hypothetical protein
LNNTAPGLKHQKAQQKKEAVGLDVWYACTNDELWAWPSQASGCALVDGAAQL